MILFFKSFASLQQMERRAHLLLCLAAALFLSACATGVKIDKQYTSENQDSRVLFLVLHYTVGNFESSLKTLTLPSSRPVSSHYLVQDSPVKTYKLVDETQRAWHAGPSTWKGHTNLNASSIGIEIVNAGPLKTKDGIKFAPFSQAQIDEVLALSKEIVARHKIRPERIVGHSDIQPQSKQDPGPMFPWKQFADAGLIAWPDAALVEQRKAVYAQELPSLEWFQTKLADHGFGVPRSGELDAMTRNVISAFQMKYRPALYNGEPDAETAALLDVVNNPEGMRLSSPPLPTKPYTSRC
jgi:N-acetylmuramoyl-L-alanine amidase